MYKLRVLVNNGKLFVLEIFVDFDILIVVSLLKLYFFEFLGMFFYFL